MKHADIRNCQYGTVIPDRRGNKGNSQISGFLPGSTLRAQSWKGDPSHNAMVSMGSENRDPRLREGCRAF